MAKPIWQRTWTRVVGIIGGLVAFATGLAAITGQFEVIWESIHKTYLHLAPSANGIVIETVNVGRQIQMESVILNGIPRKFAVIKAEISILNRGERDATNCKARITDDKGNDLMDASLNVILPGHGVESQFALEFWFLDAKYDATEAVKVYCDGLISKPFKVELPIYPLSSD